MKNIFNTGRKLGILLMLCLAIGPLKAQEKASEVVIVLHGGAGTILPEYLDEEKRAEITGQLTSALTAGYELWKKGASSLDMVESAMVILENSPAFNAGRGAVFTHEGRNELDASIMYGANLDAGAVAGVTTIKNPIIAARAVMENSPHVLLAGDGAEDFAETQEIELVDPSYFYTRRAYDDLQKILDEEKNGGAINPLPDEKMGTVGAVALDQAGHISAGTSTGGMTNKRWGRIGDSPLPGAGTYANDASVGVSCTGHGEYFIRQSVAFDMHALISYKGLSVDEAAQFIILDKLKKMGAPGGLIALDPRGNAAMSFNTLGMYRGYITKSGEITIRFFELDSE